MNESKATPAETATVLEQGGETSLLDQATLHWQIHEVTPPRLSPQWLQVLQLHSEGHARLILELVQGMLKDREAIEQLQARLSMLTALVGDIANTVGETLMVLVESRSLEPGEEPLRLIASDLATTMAETFHQMGVDPESLAQATGIVLPPEGSVETAREGDDA